MKTVILYQSKYGSTKKYAEWLARDLSCGIYEIKKFSAEKFSGYDTVIFGGGIYAMGISGLDILKKNVDRLTGKNLIVFAVGASPYDEKAFRELKAKNLTDGFEVVPCFYLRGAFNVSAMNFHDKLLIGMLKKVIAKKDPSRFEPWQKALVETFGKPGDWTSPDHLRPLEEYLASLDKSESGR